ncbi:MAG: DUF433 domain-containing protein [Bacteroidetes bacterium]|nr:MAG: DUF433 domain-containing protein [Bacteroidota bacterium]
MQYREYISINPQIRFGKPCIKGTRITVYDVLSWLADDMSIEEILHDFPQLKKEQILACLEYVAHKEKQLQHA